MFSRFRGGQGKDPAEGNSVLDDKITPVEPDGDDTVPKRVPKRKSKDMMSSILQESVWETVFEDFRSNETFVTERDGEVVYVGLLLDTDDIGGVNKKSSRDEAKGSMIECINGGRVRVYINHELMEDEFILFIPEPDTLDAMDEFNMLVTAPYTFGFVTQDGEVERSGVLVSFQDVADLSSMGGDLNDFLASKGVTWAESDAFDHEGGDYYVDDSMDDMPFGDDDVPSAGFVRVDDEIDVSDDDDTLSDVELDPSFVPGDDIIYDDELPMDELVDEDFESYDDGDEPIEEITEERVQEAITRVFYSDDLGLEVTTEPFDAQFLHGNPYIPFEEDRGEGWLNNYVAQMAKDANVEMRRLHQENLFKAREMYYRVISDYCENIQRDLDVDDPDTQYGQITDALKRDRLDAVDNVEREVSKKKNALEADWESKLQQVGDDAARAARQQYRERFGRAHDEAKYRLEPTIKAQIEADYENAVRELHKKRQNEASKRLDYGITEALNEISKQYMAMVEQEQEAYRTLRAEMNEFIDNHRKDDIARTQALADELRQSTEVERAMVEYQEKLKSETESFEARRLTMLSEIEDIKRGNETAIRDLKKASEDRLADIQKEKEEVQAKLDDMVKRYAELDQQKEREYADRLAIANDMSKQLEAQVELERRTGKRSGYFSTALTVVLAITTLCVGVIFGLKANLRDAGIESKTTIEQEFNDRLDQVEDDILGGSTNTDSTTTKPSTTTTPIATKPAATTPPETTTPVETTPSSTTPAETKPVGGKDVDVKPATVGTANVKPVDKKSSKVKPVNTKPATKKVVNTTSADTKAD